jgi:hypothetical protein
MDEKFARMLAQATAANLRRLEDWQADRPRVADYRVTNAVEGLKEAVKALEALERDEHYTETGLGRPLGYAED